jgi:hypothetical protein
MDRILKQQILKDINEFEVVDLIELINLGDISIDEIAAAGLDRLKLNSVYKTLNLTNSSELAKSSFKPTEEEIREICLAIENDQYDVLEIRNFLQNGAITPDHLRQYTSMTDDVLDKIKYYQKSPTPFTDWTNLPPLQQNRTDIYFLGQPGSGKSCVLGSLFYFFEKNGLLVENMQNQTGTLYRNQLKDEFSYGVLPDSTAVDGVNYMPIELRNLKNLNIHHPLNFIEMSGEIFDAAYEKGIKHIHPMVKQYLSNNNRKILFFVIDYDLHKKSEKISHGAGQSSKLTSVLEILDNYGTLLKIDAIYVLVTKSDLFPPDIAKVEYAKEFINNSYLNFVNNLRDKKEKFAKKNSFKITIYPFTIGEVRFKNLLTQYDESSAEYVTKAIQMNAFVKKKSGVLGSLFGN